MQVFFQSLPLIKFPLLKPIYKAYYPIAKVKNNESIIVGYHDKSIIAIVRFRPIERYQLLTGMLVLPEYQHKGIGQQLLAYCESAILTSDHYCFAYQHLENFYHNNGFHVVQSVDLPAPLRFLFQRYISSGKKLVAMQYKHTDMS
ncbi:GNAT family N-acetyltransferase [Vibrio sp. S17_S38]|uniref:GNAT family N-acetyltransferase n=1 Tax=Vibrio sp. S17_S38 TaxID=2720229 RepID=UPI00168140A1|nr:GNAT family N-acetyltransferase [Vibrio sp. S17_S38]MBD1574656.1 GNAT family N-acetyltransferase [Vibrio sp. S17_S38]